MHLRQLPGQSFTWLTWLAVPFVEVLPRHPYVMIEAYRTYRVLGWTVENSLTRIGWAFIGIMIII